MTENASMLKPKLTQVLQCPECPGRTTLMITREAIVCPDCGLCLDGLMESDNKKKISSKPYLPKHHFNERMAAFTCTGPKIKQTLLRKIKQNIQTYEKTFGVKKENWGPKTFAKIFNQLSGFEKINFSKNKFHERWIWIKKVLEISKSPDPPRDLVERLKDRYNIVYRAFEFVKFKCKNNTKGYVKHRENVININFIILNILKHEGVLQEYGSYFSEVKGLITNYSGLYRYWHLFSYIIRNVFEEEGWNEPVVTIEEINKLKKFI